MAGKLRLALNPEMGKDRPPHSAARSSFTTGCQRVILRLLSLREYRKAQFEALEEALGAHLQAQNAMVDRLLAKLEALFRAPSGEPEAGRRLDS